MPTHKEIADALAILTAGRIVPAIAKSAAAARKEAQAFRALSRAAQARTAGATIARGGRFVGRQAITKNPYGLAALILYEGYIHREQLYDLAVSLGATMEDAVEFYESETGTLPYRSAATTAPLGALGFGMPAVRKRKVSKSNRAVKQAMTWLKAGTKASSGTKPGKLPTGAFKIAVAAASMANPNTSSVIGKAKSIVNKIARRLKKWW